MTPIQRLLTSIETEPWSALYRGAAGFALPAIFRTICAECTSIWGASAMFLGFLVALRAIPLLLRITLPFSVEVKTIWATQRTLSKQLDSYAWQKLFWIGLGLLAHEAIVGGLRSGEIAVMLFCLISGGAGLWRWRMARTVPPGVGATGTVP